MASRERVDDIDLREPIPADGRALWQLARDTGLDLNSPYAYLLVASHWAPTSVIAERDGRAVGFVSGYRPPTHPDAWFCWQVGVSEEARGCGLARRMILHILGRTSCDSVRWVEATVTPTNVASQKLFASVARQLDTSVAVTPCFSADMFPSGHDAEELHRVGPFDLR